MDYEKMANGGGIEVGVEDDFEDLYEDVNVGSFQPTGATSQGEQQAELWEEDYNSPNPAPAPQQQEQQRPTKVESLARPEQPQVPAPEQQNHARDVQPPPSSEQLPAGPSSVFISELQWYTSDTELESVLSECGKVQKIKFFEERASGKSKGCCRVDFYDSRAAALCKENVEGKVFNGKACVVQLATPQVIKEMSVKYGSGPGPSQGGNGSGVNAQQGGPGNPPTGKRSAGRGAPTGRGRGRGRGNNQFPMMQEPYAPTFAHPMRPEMYAFMGRGYPMPYPPFPHAFGRGAGMDPRSWGDGVWNDGDEGQEKLQEETSEFHGSPAGGNKNDGGRRHRDERSRDKDREYNKRDRGDYSKRDRDNEDDYSSRKRRHSNRND